MPWLTFLLALSVAFTRSVAAYQPSSSIPIANQLHSNTQMFAPDLSPHFRGRLALTVNPETGEHLCISCRQCERVCPDKCIEITAHKSPETNKLELIDFKIDHGLCMFFGPLHRSVSYLLHCQHE